MFMYKFLSQVTTWNLSRAVSLYVIHTLISIILGSSGVTITLCHDRFGKNTCMCVIRYIVSTSVRIFTVVYIPWYHKHAFDCCIVRMILRIGLNVCPGIVGMGFFALITMEKTIFYKSSNSMMKMSIKQQQQQQLYYIVALNESNVWKSHFW